MRFLLDMGISASVALWLRDQGHDAVHLNDQSLNGLPDDAIIRKAMNEDRIILTSDMDFGQLLALHKLEQVSVIQFRISDFKPINVKKQLELLFDRSGGQLEGYFIITIEDNRIRTRSLPI